MGKPYLCSVYFNARTLQAQLEILSYFAGTKSIGVGRNVKDYNFDSNFSYRSRLCPSRNTNGARWETGSQNL
jgi:hypothetical protein